MFRFRTFLEFVVETTAVARHMFVGVPKYAAGSSGKSMGRDADFMLQEGSRSFRGLRQSRLTWVFPFRTILILVEATAGSHRRLVDVSQYAAVASAVASCSCFVLQVGSTGYRRLWMMGTKAAMQPHWASKH